MKTRTGVIFPIKFAKLRNESEFTIFAEPSRGVKLSTDKTTYIKKCEAYSVSKDDPDKAIILLPDDLVQPLTRGE